MLSSEVAVLAGRSTRRSKTGPLREVPQKSDWQPSKRTKRANASGVLSGVIEQFGQTGALHALARHDVGENADGTDLFETHPLASDILIAGADAHDTNFCCHNCLLAPS